VFDCLQSFFSKARLICQYDSVQKTENIFEAL